MNFLCTRPTETEETRRAAAYVSWRQQVEMRKNGASAPRREESRYLLLYYILTFEGWQRIYSVFEFNDGTQRE